VALAAETQLILAPKGLRILKNPYLIKIAAFSDNLLRRNFFGGSACSPGGDTHRWAQAESFMRYKIQ